MSICISRTQCWAEGWHFIFNHCLFEFAWFSIKCINILFWDLLSFLHNPMKTKSPYQRWGAKDSRELQDKCLWPALDLWEVTDSLAIRARPSSWQWVSGKNPFWWYLFVWISPLEFFNREMCSALWLTLSVRHTGLVIVVPWLRFC